MIAGEVAGKPYVFFHAPKTGGTWVEHLLESRGLVRTRTGQHDPAFLHMRPRGLRVGTTRDPWSGYVSLYTHAVNACEPHFSALRAYGRGDTSFKAVLYGWTHRLPSPRVGALWDGIAGSGEAFRRGTWGLWSWAHLYHYGTERAWKEGVEEWAVDVLVDQSRLVEGVREITGVDGYHFPRVNVGTIHDYLQFYDAEMNRWVEEADGVLASRLGQSPSGPSRAAVVVVS